MSTFNIVLVLLVALSTYAAWITVLVLRSKGLERDQKIAQCALVWLLPPMGTLAVHLIHWAQEREPMQRHFAGVVPQEDQGVSPNDFTGASHH